MSEWKTIDSAPVDRRVKVGKWSYYGDNKRWIIDTAIVFKTEKFLFWNRKVGTHDSTWYSHWQELDEPPVST